MPHRPTPDDRCKAFLDAATADFDGYMPFSDAARAEQEAQNIFATYGELLFESSSKLLRALRLTPQDTFYDLGSGTGRLCAQAFLSTYVQHVVGIEVVHERHVVAQALAERIPQQFPKHMESGRSLRFVEANFLDVDISDATVLYTCSTAFSKDLVATIAERAKTCTNLRYFLSLRPSPFHLPLLHDVIAPCSWGHFTHCYIYGPRPEDPEPTA